jgi:hypothetical protein
MSLSDTFTCVESTSRNSSGEDLYFYAFSGYGRFTTRRQINFVIGHGYDKGIIDWYINSDPKTIEFVPDVVDSVKNTAGTLEREFSLW